jgi:hypothetical protein
MSSAVSTEVGPASWNAEANNTGTTLDLHNLSFPYNLDNLLATCHSMQSNSRRRGLLEDARQLFWTHLSFSLSLAEFGQALTDQGKGESDAINGVIAPRHHQTSNLHHRRAALYS